MRNHSRIRLFALSVCFMLELFTTRPVWALGTQREWGTYLTPFSVTSPWNARPVNPVFADYEIPVSTYFPNIAEGKYSTGVFLARRGDQPIDIFSRPGQRGIWDPDAEAFKPSVTIPRWPRDVIPAAGADGHADIVDPVTGIVHSFWQLKQVDGQWQAQEYSWARIDGRGWGDPAHYFQGARAAAVPSMGGIIRRHEINDGEPMYRHVLAMSMTFNGLGANPAYVFPATSADSGAENTNSGQIPEGALVMLPPGFDTASLPNPKLRKIAETLKTYGAYIVDRNVGTPFYIYIENGSNFSLRSGKAWDGALANDLQTIRKSLRQVVRTSGWLDGNGHPMDMDRRLNLLSMRGTWKLEKGSALGEFQTWQQAVVFAAGNRDTVQSNSNDRQILHPVAWAHPSAGEKFLLTSVTTGGGRLRLQLIEQGSSRTLFDSGALDNGAVAVITWPQGGVHAIATAYSGGSDAGSSVGGTLVQMAPERANASVH